MPPSHSRLIRVAPADGTGLRLDRYVCDILGLFPRSQIDKRGLQVSLGGKTLKMSYRISGGEELVVTWEDPPAVSFDGEELPLEPVFENNEVLVLNKARGMVVHPAHGHHAGTLVQGLLHRLDGLKAAFGEAERRPGIVHRLDKDTTGLIITAKTPAALEFLAGQFRDKSTEKVYLAVVKGRLPQAQGRIQTHLARDEADRKRFAATLSRGKPADTVYRVLGTTGVFTLVELRPRTGRTHQLRVHMQHLGTPILGDPIYARVDRSFPEAPLMLHAWSLTIRLPGASEPCRFTAPWPSDFQWIADATGLARFLPALS